MVGRGTPGSPRMQPRSPISCNGPRFPAGTFPTVGSCREQLVFDNSFPPPWLSGEGSIHARTQTGTHGRSTTRRWPGGARSLPVPEGRPPPRAAPFGASRHFYCWDCTLYTTVHARFPRLVSVVSSNIYSPFPRRWKSVPRFFLPFCRFSYAVLTTAKSYLFD